MALPASGPISVSGIVAEFPNVNQTAPHRFSELYSANFYIPGSGTLKMSDFHGELYDTTPDAFTFTNVTGAAVSSVRTSNTITITGIRNNTSVGGSLSAGSNLQFSVNGGAWASSATLTGPSQTLAVRLTTTATGLQTHTATVNVGGVTYNWTVQNVSTVLQSGTTTMSCGSSDCTAISSPFSNVAGTFNYVSGNRANFNNDTITIETGSSSTGPWTVVASNRSPGSSVAVTSGWIRLRTGGTDSFGSNANFTVNWTIT